MKSNLCALSSLQPRDRSICIILAGNSLGLETIEAFIEECKLDKAKATIQELMDKNFSLMMAMAYTNKVDPAELMSNSLDRIKPTNTDDPPTSP